MAYVLGRTRQKAIVDVDPRFIQECNITSDFRKMRFGELERNRVDLII